MKFGYKNIKMVWVNQFFKPPYYFPGRISSKIGRKVVQENCEVMSTFHITLRGTTSLKFWKFRFFLHFSIIYTFKNNILKFQVEILNSFWVTAFWRAAAH